MTIQKTFLCLANSRKTSGRCIAGKETDGNEVGEWVRPISERENHEISEIDRRYSNRETAKVLDIVKVQFKHKSDHPAQEENYTIDDRYYWSKVGTYNQDLAKFLDSPDSLWENNSSSYNGILDRVAVSEVVSERQSLYFIQPTDFKILVRTEGAEFGNAKKKLRANFEYNSVNYQIAITDPEVEANYLRLGEGEYRPEGTIYMTISLGEPYDGYYYKLAATILEV